LTEELLLATTNQGKIREMQAFLAELPILISSIQNLRVGSSFQETGKTFKENARGKSLFYSRKWEGITLAEDSGLEIDYLKGAPGVISARFSGPIATDETNIEKILDLMKEVEQEHRKARFVSCMVLSRKANLIKTIMGYVEGYITFQKKGTNGFGYDPIFYFPPLKKTFAELRPEEKNIISHRGQALKKLKSFLSLNYS
jgi:XTP/dITP diphosphohydrolase